MKYKLRKATLDDLAILADHNQAMAEETENKTLNREVLENGLGTVLTDESKGFYLVAVDDKEQVAANLMITIEWSDWRNAPVWWFQSVYVRLEHRRKGIFAQMYEEVKAMAKAANVPELRLYVEKENTSAQKVYEQLGMAQSHYLMYEVDL